VELCVLFASDDHTLPSCNDGATVIIYSMQQQLIHGDACETIDTKVATDRERLIQAYQSIIEHDCHEKTLKP